MEGKIGSSRRRSADGERAEAAVAGWRARSGAAAGEAPTEKEPRLESQREQPPGKTQVTVVVTCNGCGVGAEAV